MTTIEINGKEYQLDIDKAKEQGLLKEKDSKPRSWEEYVKMAETVQIVPCDVHANYFYKKDKGRRITYDVFNSVDKAKAFCALGKLIQLRDAWVGDWKPDWTNDKEYKWIIQYDYNDVHIYHSFVASRPLSFPTKDMAIEFFDAFSGLLGQAKMFL